MQNDEGKIVDIYIPRKCSATGRLIPSHEHGTVQLNVGQRLLLHPRLHIQFCLLPLLLLRHFFLFFLLFYLLLVSIRCKRLASGYSVCRFHRSLCLQRH
ncbi:UNVERIFIED_CONTAM: hypothetical protein H355_006402 [Colinus virginianus]|nr:hypothetical protein H355_006402 [Colinus virginianus]